MLEFPLPDPENDDPFGTKDLMDQLKKDARNLTEEEFDRRQSEIMDKAGFRKIEERPDLMNGWVEPDGTFHRLLKPDWHEMWSLEKFGIRHRELMYRGWVKVTQWERQDKSVGMYFTELTPEQ